MTKFIKVTEVMTGGDEKPLLINMSHIQHVQGGLHGKNTHIRMSIQNAKGDYSYYFVKETALEIWEQINSKGCYA